MNASNTGLNWTSYNSNTNIWTADAPIPGIRSCDAPGIAAYKGDLYCVRTTNTKDSELWWNIYDSETGYWSTAEPVIDVDGKRIPGWHATGVTHANDFLYCIHYRTVSDDRLWWTRFNTEGPERGWSLPKPLNVCRPVNRWPAPRATVYNGLLYCVQRERSGYLVWFTHDTNTKSWSGVRTIPGNIPADEFSITLFNGHLHCVYNRVGDSNSLYWTTYNSDTKTWSKEQLLRDRNGEQIYGGDAAISPYNDRLYCVYRAGHYAYTRYDIGQGWSPPVIVTASGHPILPNQYCDITPYNGLMYCVHDTR
jgi:hypothetical protein